ncbi:hypothetical protein JB92DRAFT_2851825 [Gautieria morchelliformis]|nr:hypothetical protein JB92DRAFT_2851825 [Gautieria morchelliformis]
MSKLFGRSIATLSSSSANSTKQRVDSEPFGSSYVSNMSPTASSRGGSASSMSPVPLAKVTRASLPQSGAPRPYSQTEVYWAARALRSETLLAARTTHHHEVRKILSSAEVKRAREVAELKREHDARHSRLEAVALVLSLLLLLLAVAVLYLLARSSSRQRTPEASRWGLPHHLTIPVLSPFTSVVESESAVIGARSLTVLSVVSGAVVYGLIRYRLNRPAN